MRLEDLLQLRQAGFGRRVIRMGLPVGLADHVADRLPDRRLGDEVDVSVGVGLPALALEDSARLTAARGVAGARHRVAERDAFAELAVFLQGPMREPLLIAQLDAAKVQHAVLHRAVTFWPRPDFSRWNSAVTMPRARCTPVPESPICAPVTSGRPSWKPVVDAEPPAHCATFS